MATPTFLKDIKGIKRMAGKYLDLDLDINLGGDNSSDIRVASQKAIKTYVDTKTSQTTNVDELQDLTDVSIETLEDGQILVYDSETQKWINDEIITQWGDISGTLSQQTDLNNALNNKANLEHTHLMADITDLSIPTKTSDLQNDSNFISSIPAEYITQTELTSELESYAKTTDIPTQPSDINAQPLIDSNNKLLSDLVNTTGQTNLFVTSTEKTTWSGKQDAITDLQTIRSGAADGATALQPNDNISQLTNDVGYLTSIPTEYITETELNAKNYLVAADIANKADKSEIPTVNDSTITINTNGTLLDTFTLNQATAKTIDITIPTDANDIGALPNTTKYGKSISLELNSSTYVLTLTLKDQDGTTLNSQTVDFPIESVVVGGSYNDTDKKIVLTLQNGTTIDVPVGDLIAGLQTEITSTNKLNADLIENGTTNLLVNQTEKTAWNGKTVVTFRKW